MSLINDALKQARQVPPRNPPGAFPPLQPVSPAAAPVNARFIGVLILTFILAAVFFVGWAMAHHAVRSIVAAPAAPTAAPVAVAAKPSVVEAPPPVVAPPPVEPQAPLPVNPPAALVLQGIFYSPKDPSAIVNGKTVRPGDQFRQYLVKAITKNNVTLVGPDQKEITLSMGK